MSKPEGLRLRLSSPPVLAWALLFAAVLALAIRDWSSFQFGSWTDDAKYVLLSRALVAGQDYRIAYGPEPEAASFPFLLPLALTPFTRLAPEAVDAGKLVSLISTLTTIAALFWGWPLLSGLRSRWWGLAAAAFYGLSPHVVGMSHMVMAEPLLTALVVLALLASERAARSPRPAVGAYALVGFLATCAFYARTAGISLVVALLLRGCWRHRAAAARPLLSMALGGLLFVTPVMALTSVRAPDLLPWMYLRNVPQPFDPAVARFPLIAQVGESMREYALGSLREGLLSVGGGERERLWGERIGLPHLSAGLSLALTALVLIGVVWSCTGALRPSVLLFELFYAGVILLWHVRGWRLVLPLVPFLSLQLVWGTRFLVSTVAAAARVSLRRRHRLATAAAVASAGLILSMSLLRVARAGPTSLDFVRDLTEGTAWLRRYTAPDAVVVAEEPASVHIYAQRPVIRLPNGLTAEGLWALARRSHAQYLLLAPALLWADDGIQRYNETTAALLPAIEAAAARGDLELVYESPPAQKVRVYRFTEPDGGPAPPRP